MVRQNLSEQILNVVVASASDDGSDEFDFDAGLTIVIDFAFHMYSVAQCLRERKGNLRNPCNKSVGSKGSTTRVEKRDGDPVKASLEADDVVLVGTWH